MAELAVFSLAKNVLSASASPALKMAYEQGLSIWEAKGELDKLRVTIETIVAVLLDADKKQEGSAAIRNWIKRLKGVLYDSEDLFDDVETEELLKQHILKKGTNKLSKKVQIGCSRLNPIISRYSIANKVKAIRKRLTEISRDMADWGFVKCDSREEGFNSPILIGQDPGSFIDSKSVIGRDNDKKSILEMLLHDEFESYSSKKDDPFVIAIVGIGGMGKTTLAQLIYNDVEVQNNFQCRWFACISDVYDDKEVLGKIYQSICGKNYDGFTVSQMQSSIRDSIGGKKFLLVLDDVWDDERTRWEKRMGLLGGGTKGSRIIVTTRSSPVAEAVKALKTHNLDGLSEDDSWDLFKKLAFAHGNENDPRRIDLGKEIVKKCRNVPLAIRSIASLLCEKNTIQEWESIRNEELSKLGQSHEDGIMPVLKLSYNHLPSNLKQCFASCSLFPKDYRLKKLDLIYLWIAQGYVLCDNEKQTLEDVGHIYFMYLFRRGFFQEAIEDDAGEIQSCKMHDLIHDLVLHVAGEENIVLTTSSSKDNCARNVSVGYKISPEWTIPAPWLKVDGIRSLMFMQGDFICEATLSQLFANFKSLRTLSLCSLGIEELPSCIGELRHLRGLDLSDNKFKRLPDSMTKLVNLLRLVLIMCSRLEALPDNFRQLINLRYLNITDCYELRSMPAGIEELIHLQFLSHFKVAKERDGVKWSGLDALAGLQLRGKLLIEFEDDIDNWDEEQYSHLPESLQVLNIYMYPGVRIQDWASGIAASALTSLTLDGCSKVNYLPTLSCCPNLRYLSLNELEELEYVEEEEEDDGKGRGCDITTQGYNSSSTFFPRLEILVMQSLPKVKGWRRKDRKTATPSPLLFLSLSELYIQHCPELKSIPLCPRAHRLCLTEVGYQVVHHLLLSVGSNPSPSPSVQVIEIFRCRGITSFSDEALASLRELTVRGCGDLKIMELTSPHLEFISIRDCDELTTLQFEGLPSLCAFVIDGCKQLKKLKIFVSPELELWEEGKTDADVDWDLLPDLSLLIVNSLPPSDMLPNSLRQRQALGQLQIVSMREYLSEDIESTPGLDQPSSLDRAFN